MPQFPFFGDGFYLVTVHDDGEMSLDGPHEDASGVAEARYLLRNLGLDKGVKERHMVHVMPAPAEDGSNANEEALAVLKAIGLR